MAFSLVDVNHHVTGKRASKSPPDYLCSWPTPAIRHDRSRGAGISRIAVIHQVSFSALRPAGVGQEWPFNVQPDTVFCVYCDHSKRSAWIGFSRATPKDCDATVIKATASTAAVASRKTLGFMLTL